MLEVKTTIKLGKPISIMGVVDGAYPNKDLISENTFVVFCYDQNNYKTMYGFKNSMGKELGGMKYSSVTAFKDGLAWVFNENDVPILLNKNGKEVLYSKNAMEYALTKNMKLLDKEKKDYLKTHKSYAKKNKFEDEDEVYVFKNKKKCGLKEKNGTTILPAEYDDIYVSGDIVVIDGMVYSARLLKPTYEVTISYNDLSVTETFNNYVDMKNYVSKFKKEFETNLLLIHEEFEKMLKQIQENENISITKSFYDADKKVQNEVIKHNKSKK